MKVLGTLKGAQLQSKLDGNSPVHTLIVKVELTEGIDETYILHDWLKQPVTLEMVTKQPTLVVSVNDAPLNHKD